jgi:PAS domain S-box-containing protein
MSRESQVTSPGDLEPTGTPATDRARGIPKDIGAASSHSAAPNASSRTMRVRRALFVFIAALSAGLLATAALPRWGGRALWFLPSGIAAAAVIRWGPSQWLPVFAAELALELFRGRGLIPGLAVATGLPAGALVMRWLLERHHFHAEFSQRTDVPLFIVAGLIGMTVPAVIGTVVLATYYPIDPADALTWSLADSARWWFNDVTGVLLLGPLLITVRKASFDSVLRQRAVAAGCLAVTIGIAIAVAYSPASVVATGASRLTVLALSVMLVTVTSLRLGFVATALAIAILTVVEATSYSFHLGIFRGMEAVPGLVALWELIGTMIGVSLILTALLAEQRRGELRYTRLFETTPQPIMVLDATTGRFLSVNAAAERQYGWPSDELTDQSMQVLAPPSGERVLPAEHSGSANVHLRTRHRTRDGRVLPVDVWAHTMEFDGRSALVVFADDVTDRTRAEDELRASEQKFAALFRNAALPATLTSAPDHRYVDVNDAWLRLFGFAREQLLGKTSLDVGINRDAERRNLLIRDLQAYGSVPDQERTMYTRSGEALTVLVSIARVWIADREYAVTTLLDITERKRLESLLFAEAQRNREFLRNASDGAHILDETGRLIEVSASFCVGLGYSREELLGRFPSWWDPVQSDDAVRRSILRTLAGESHPLETLHRRKDGTTFEVEIRSKAFTVDNRRYVYCSSRDLTEVRRLERAMLSAADRERNKLGLDLHDGLGQELTGISLLFASLVSAEKRAGRATDSRFVQVGELLARAISTCRAIAHGLSPIGTVGGGLSKALDEMVRLQRGSRGPAIRFDAIGAMPTRLDPETADQLYRIAQEAVANAQRHARASAINVTLKCELDGVVLEIVDDGMGISQTTPIASGIGISSMNFRAQAIGARLTIEAGARGGTRIICRLWPKRYGEHPQEGAPAR